MMKQHKTDTCARWAASTADDPEVPELHFSVSLDLGQEASTNAANYTAGQGAAISDPHDDDHQLTAAQYNILGLDGTGVERSVPALTALNERLRQTIDDCAKGVLRWNKVIERAGIDFEMKLPHRAFHRRSRLRRHACFARGQGARRGRGRPTSKWLPSDEDRALSPR